MAASTLLILFDIDGTLVNTDGAGRRALARATTALIGRDDLFDGIRFHGATDPEILDQGLARLSPDESLSAQHLLERYLSELQSELSTAGSVTLPGAADLVRGLAARPHIQLGLVTGNVRRGAILKLTPDSLHSQFAFGGFGCDHRDRAELIRIAVNRSAEYRPEDDDLARVVYVGDTERDIEAALRTGVTAVGVATGPMDAATLAEAGADVVFDSLPPMLTFLEQTCP